MEKAGPKVPLFPLLLVNFIGTLGYSIILPFLVVVVLSMGGNALVYGILGATYSVFQLVGAPILGRWSDRVGRRKILLLSQAGTFAAWVLFLAALVIPVSPLLDVDSELMGVFTLTLPLVLIFCARALDGITGGNVSVANAYLADVTDEKDRKTNFGKMAASANLGFIIGPAIAGLLGATVIGEKLPVIAALIISLVAVLVIAFYLPESRSVPISSTIDECNMKKVLGQEHKEGYTMECPPLTFSAILKMKSIPYLVFLYFLIFLAFNFFYVCFPIHAVRQFEWTVFQLGWFFSIVGFVMAVVEGPVLSRISRYFSDNTLNLTGSILLAASLFLLTTDSEPALYLSAVLFSSGNGIMWPSFLSILSKATGAELQGAVQGVAGSAGSFASVLGLVAGGILYGSLGPTTFLIPGFLMILIFFLSVRLPSEGGREGLPKPA